MSFCPYLPIVGKEIKAERLRSLAYQGDDLYVERLRFAQSYWLQKKPAQAILQLNRAWSLAGTSELMLASWPWPYAALAWILENREEEGFIGNPVRHFQHYATRMSGENREVRRGRAWACFLIAETVLPEEDYPRDSEQVEKESLRFPNQEEISSTLCHCASEQERDAWLRVLANCRASL